MEPSFRAMSQQRTNGGPVPEHSAKRLGLEMAARLADPRGRNVRTEQLFALYMPIVAGLSPESQRMLPRYPTPYPVD